MSTFPGMQKLLECSALTPLMAEFLRQTVLSKSNIVVTGKTGSGKTTILRALSEMVAENERIVSVEDEFELHLEREQVVPLQSSKTNMDLGELLQNVLRMRPDRVIVGEIRESSCGEAFLAASNVGHEGIMTTFHSGSTPDALNSNLTNLANLIASDAESVNIVQQNLAGAIDLIVHVARKDHYLYIESIAIVDATFYLNGTISPEVIFVGEYEGEGKANFRHVSGVRTDTRLGMKLADAGFETSQWEPQT